MTILIDLCLIFAIWRLFKRPTKISYPFKIIRIPDWEKKVNRGLTEQAVRKAAIAEKFAERAFSLASTANLTCMYLQKSLATRPPFVSHQKQLQNEVIQAEVQKAVGGTTQDMAGFDWLYPVLSEEERDIVDKALDHSAKYKKETP